MAIYGNRAHVENVHRDFREGEGPWGLAREDHERRNIFRQRQSRKVHREYLISETYRIYPEMKSKLHELDKRYM